VRGSSLGKFLGFAACCTCFVIATMASSEATKARKGRNFSPDEERQLCRSCLHISQDPITGNGQRSSAFWERILKHYNDHRPAGCDARPSRSLETKWGLIKHDVAKFCGVYKQVLALNESGMSAEDVLERSLELYKVKHPKQLSFVFLHCWLLLKDVPRWWDLPTDVQQRNTRKERTPVAMPKRSNAEVPTSASDADLMAEEDDVEIVDDISFTKRPKRPQGTKVAKEDQRAAKQREHAVRAQARATADMAMANMRKAQILHDQATLSLFTMPNKDSLSDMAREYLNLRREEEMYNLKQRLAERKEQEARALAEARKLADERATEVAAATQNRIPPPPQRELLPRRGPAVSPSPIPASQQQNSGPSPEEPLSRGKYRPIFFFSLPLFFFPDLLMFSSYGHTHASTSYSSSLQCQHLPKILPTIVVFFFFFFAFFFSGMVVGVWALLCIRCSFPSLFRQLCRVHPFFFPPY
jgi:hypothetical protein